MIRQSAFAIAVAAGAMMAASQADASVVNFGQYAQDNGEGGIGAGHTYLSPLVPDGVNLTFSGLEIAGINGIPYLDAFSGGKPGGLGNCSGAFTAGDQCDPSDDDNISTSMGGGNEGVKLSLENGVKFAKFQVTEFRDDDHNLINTAKTLSVKVDGVETLTTFATVLATEYNNFSLFNLDTVATNLITFT